MECNKIQEKLSAYIENLVLNEEKAFIEQHLKSCEKCSESLSDLKKAVEHIKNLEEVAPPPWLTHRIMSKVKVEAKKTEKGILQKLFLPLYIKTPIGAAATIAIALTTIYIFKTISPEIKLAKAPGEVVEKNEVPPPVIGEGVPDLDVISKTKAPASQDKTFAFDERKAVSPKPAEQSQPAKNEILGKLTETSKAPAPAVKQDQAVPSAGIASKEELKREPAAATPKLKALTEQKEMRTSQDIRFERIISEQHPNGASKTIITYKVTTAGRQKIMEERFNKNGERHGVHREYYDSGTLKAAVEYSHGKLTWHIEFYPNGEKKREDSKNDWLWLRQHTGE